jgi:hypothetical protein
MNMSIKEEKSSIKVLVVYESFESGIRAARVYEHLVSTMKGDFLFDVAFYRWDVLEVLVIGENTVRKAEGADLILVAPESCAEVPVGLRRWMGKWVPPKAEQGQNSALVLVAKQEEIIEGKLVDFLKSMAQQGKMTFITGESAIAEMFKGRD